MEYPAVSCFVIDLFHTDVKIKICQSVFPKVYNKVSGEKRDMQEFIKTCRHTVWSIQNGIKWLLDTIILPS